LALSKPALPIRKDEMRNTMGITGKLWFFLIMLIGPALAQNRVTEPSPAVTGPAYDVSTGYTYLTMPLPAAGHVSLNGLDVSGSIALGPRWGATLDTNYLRTSDVLGIAHPAYMLNTQGGPEFYPFEHGNTRIFVRALAGATLVDGALPVSDIDYYHGWVVRFSYALGAGVEHSVSGPVAVRVNGDYLHTAFFDSVGTVQPQNNFRATASLVFRLRHRQHGVVIR
jgi:hypothetical protein